MYKKILIRFGELSTKGKNKMTFVRKLASNIKLLAKATPKVEYDRIFLEYSPETMKNLQYVFGIYSYSPVVVCDSNLEEIKQTIFNILPQVKGETFKVETKRSWKEFSPSSMEVSQIIGGEILKNFPSLKVKIKDPDLKVEIEIREKNTYIFIERVLGLGGYPTGINGRVLHLISGGIDSPVAAWEMMKRGIHVDFLNFITPPHTDEKTIVKVDNIIKQLIKYQGSATLYRSNYSDLLNLLGLVSNQAYKINLMRRSFYRIASQLAHKQKYLALSNGENLGQVASQTIESIVTINSQATLPVFRPLLTYDKLETISKAQKIGTYELSIEKAFESCELFAPKEPITKPRHYVSEALEKELAVIEEFEQKNINENIDITKFELE